ncbi:hypothetical protein [Jongsikchunia kroppenstedtii]|uniref:hypothetical protein n=1 Tax=Jongsikchunia kroppenstedtii TaxID=1121721 RepID=UPI000363A29A|nr:hypothetical protein [Jongsikchunia kroppenstedtii]
MSEVRVLSVGELADAVDVLAPVLREAPLNEWLLGECADDVEVQRWLIELQLIESLRAGYVLGGFDRGELVGVLAWSPPDPYAPRSEPEFQRRSIELLEHRPGLRQRLAEFHRAAMDNPPPQRSATMLLAGLAPRARATDVMAKLMAPVLDAATGAGACVWFATAALEIGASSIARFGFEAVGEYTVGPVTMHAYLKPYEAA